MDMNSALETLNIILHLPKIFRHYTNLLWWIYYYDDDDWKSSFLFLLSVKDGGAERACRVSETWLTGIAKKMFYM